jgi:hypothetical protein
VTAVRARHEVATLVAGFVLTFDGADASNRRRRHNKNLSARKGSRAGFGQCHGITLAIDVQRITIHLIEEQVAHRHRTQADGAVGPGHHQRASCKTIFGKTA